MNYSQFLLQLNHTKLPPTFDTFVREFDHKSWLLNRMNSEKSKDLLNKVLSFRSTGNLDYMSDFEVNIDKQYLDFILPLQPKSYIDVGGFDGDTAKLFEAIDENEFKAKLEDTINKMQETFDMNSENTDASGIHMDNMPDPEKIHEHVAGMMDGKLGKLAHEIAEETAKDLNMNTLPLKHVLPQPLLLHLLLEKKVWKL